MAAKYALQPFWWHQASGADQFVDVGALRDSASAVVAGAPGMFTAAMTLGASGVPSANPNPVPVTVTVTGGTVTVIAVGGAVTGQTTGTFTIPPGGTVTVTYSVGPSFTMGDLPPAAGGLVTGVLAQYQAVTPAGP